MNDIEAARARENFEYWLAYQEEALDTFFSRFRPEDVGRLDFSIGSLDVLEGWLLASYSGPEELTVKAAEPDLDGSSRYLGEIIRRAGKGKWRLCVENDNVFFDLPIVYDLGEGRAPIMCPLTLVTASTDRRTGTYLRGVVERMANRYFD